MLSRLGVLLASENRPLPFTESFQCNWSKKLEIEAYHFSPLSHRSICLAIGPVL